MPLLLEARVSNSLDVISTLCNVLLPSSRQIPHQLVTCALLFGCGNFQTKIQLFEILRSLEAVPGVQIETGAEVKTPATLRMPDEDDEMTDADQRASGRSLRKRALCYLVAGSGNPRIPHPRSTLGDTQLTLAFSHALFLLGS